MARYQLVVSKTIELMTAIVEVFCGNAHLSLEGDLSHCDLRGIQDISHEPTAVLKRNVIIAPKVEFVILPLEMDTKDTIIRQILPRVGLHSNVWHIKIEKDGALVFAAYDEFHPDCVWVSEQVGEDLLKSLLDDAVIREYRFVEG